MGEAEDCERTRRLKRRRNQLDLRGPEQGQKQNGEARGNGRVPCVQEQVCHDPGKGARSVVGVDEEVYGSEDAHYDYTKVEADEVAPGKEPRECV